MPKPTKDLDTIAIMERHLKRSPRTVKELAKLLGVTERTVYRWLRYLEDEGRDVVSRRNPKKPGRLHYSIIPKK